MDQNKLTKLRELQYKIHKCCGNCRHGLFPKAQHFGVCDLHKYKHAKHSGKDRNLSINVYGYCSSYRISSNFDYGIHAYKEFME